MGLLTKCVLLFALSSAFQLALLGAIIASQIETEAVSRANLHSKNMLAEAAALTSSMLMEAARIRTSVILSDRHPVFRAAAWQEAGERLRRLETMAAGDAPQMARLAQLRREIDAFHEAEAEAHTLMAEGNFDEMRERYRRSGPETVLDNLRRPLEAFMRIEKEREAERSARFERSQRRLRTLQIGALAAALLSTLPALYLFRRDIGRRLSAVSLNVHNLAEGRPLAGPVSGNDELADLDRLLHETSRRLRASEAGAQASRQELERRSQQLAAANADLQRQRQDNDMFVYSVSHDLRAPLVNMQGFSQEIGHSCRELQAALAEAPLEPALRARLAAIVDDDIAVSLRFMQSAVGRTSAIIDALLRLSRAGQVHLAPEQVDAGAVVHRVVDSMHAEIVRRGAAVRVEPLPPMWADPTTIDQIFANLVGNALAYLDPARPGRIEIGALPAEARRQPGMRTYYVKDNGMGIPKQYMGKLFTPFQRLHAHAAQGEGIGLALVQRAVERQGGRIWAESVGGQGTIFLVTMPTDARHAPLGQEVA